MQNAMTSLTPFRRALAASALLLYFGLACAHAEMSRDKQDVTDPALKEIIASFEQVMPKFVNQHGFTKFITDEAVTRGMFIRAMYEYNKFLETNVPGAKKDVPDVKEKFAQLNIRVARLESALNSPKVQNPQPQPKPGAAAPAPDQVTRQEFDSLSQQVAMLQQVTAVDRTPAPAAAAQPLPPGSPKQLVELEKRIIRLESMPPGISRQDLEDIEKRITQMQNPGGVPAAQQQGDASKPETFHERRMASATAEATMQLVAKLQQQVADLEKKMNQLAVAASKDQATNDQQNVKDIRKKINDLERKGAYTTKSQAQTAPDGEPLDMDSLNNKVHKLERDMVYFVNNAPAAKETEKTLELEKRIQLLESVVSQGSSATQVTLKQNEGFVSKTELDELRTRILSIEKSLSEQPANSR